MNNWGFSWSDYKGQLEWLPANTIYLTVHGSKAYGTNVATSDTDIRGIAIPPIQYYIGTQSVFETAEQHEPDFTIFEIRKFIKLAADANPNALELMFTPEECHIHKSPLAIKLLENRNLFLSKKAYHTFSGYAYSQFRRLKNHAAYVEGKQPPLPLREDFGLPEVNTVIPNDQLKAAEAAIQKVIDVWNWKELDSVNPDLRIGIQKEFYDKLLQITGWNIYDVPDKVWNAAAHSLGFQSNFIEYLNREKKFKAKMNEYNAYQEWKKNRNAVRAEMESQFGYDCKFAMHIVRLYLQCEYLLRDGILHVKHPDAEMLKEIRHGGWKLQSVIDFAEKKDSEIKLLYETSNVIPYSPDRAKIDQLCVELVSEHLRL